MHTPLGKLSVATSKKGVISISFVDQKYVVAKCDEAITSQLKEYFSRKRTQFDIKLDLIGTPFQLSVWKALISVGYGKTASYRYIANKIGQPQAVRAVANAIGKNPVAVVIPCHRIVRMDGSVGGYRWGAKLKSKLLELEAGC
jgi:O-6-methylguanine DNA methyltransferase